MTRIKADKRLDLWTQVNVAGIKYLRLPLQTPWLNPTDDLVLALKESLKLARPGDTVGVSEKVAILLTGRTVDINTVKPGCSLGSWLLLSTHAPTPRGWQSPRRCSTSSEPSACGGSSRQRSAVPSLGRSGCTEPLSGRWIGCAGRRRRAAAVRGRTLPALGQQGRAEDVRRSGAGTGHRRQHRRPQ